MKLPDTIERDLRDIEAEYAQRGGQQAGTPRLRGLRASIEIELQRLAREREDVRLFLGRDLKEAMERVLTLELDCQHFRAALQEYLDWGAMTGSDRDLFEQKFRTLLTPQPEPGPLLL